MLQDKYYALSTREQLILKVAIPLALLLISWLIIFKPIIDTREKYNKNIAKHLKEYQWMQENAHFVRQGINLNQSSTAAGPANKSQLRQVMNQLIKVQRLSIERIQNVNDTDVSYRLDNGHFERLIALIKSCEDRGIRIVQVQISKSKQLGAVNTRLTVATQGS